jgi:hypothetical protein
MDLKSPAETESKDRPENDPGLNEDAVPAAFLSVPVGVAVPTASILRDRSPEDTRAKDAARRSR